VLDFVTAPRPKFVYALTKLREELVGVPLVAGNVATGEAARTLADVGADVVKVGLGVGSIGTTSQVTGVGVPQLTAIADVRRVLGDYDTLVMAEGGI
jgi:IMP dehydrogenase